MFRSLHQAYAYIASDPKRNETKQSALERQNTDQPETHTHTKGLQEIHKMQKTARSMQRNIAWEPKRYIVQLIYIYLANPVANAKNMGHWASCFAPHLKEPQPSHTKIGHSIKTQKQWPPKNKSIHAMAVPK